LGPSRKVVKDGCPTPGEKEVLKKEKIRLGEGPEVSPVPGSRVVRQPRVA